jgi:heterodisulfide reductase subunit A
MVCQKAGLNPYLYEHVNVREQCSWVHNNRHQATEKAKTLVGAAVRRVCYHEPLEVKEIPFNHNTLVIGGGIAGIQAALDIADSGHKVYLVEREPIIGGHLAQLNKTFPNLKSSADILTTVVGLAESSEPIELMPYTEVEEISGYIGNFKAKIKKKARYIDETKCNGCGICWKKCPVDVDNEFDLGLSKRKAIYIYFPQSVNNIPTIDLQHCTYFPNSECQACKEACPTTAIDFKQVDHFVEVEVGSIIIATGYDPFDARLKPEYGYGMLG